MLDIPIILTIFRNKFFIEDMLSNAGLQNKVETPELPGTQSPPSRDPTMKFTFRQPLPPHSSIPTSSTEATWSTTLPCKGLDYCTLSHCLWFSDYTSTAYHECKLRKEQTFTHFYNMSPISITPVQYLAHSRYSINTWTNADRWYNFIMFLLSVFSHLHHTKYAEQMVSLFMHAITVTQITSSRLPANKNLKWTKISTHSPGILSVIHCLHKTNLPMLILLRQFVFSACA